VSAKSKEERETVIRFDETKADVEIWTASPVSARRMARAGVRPYRTTSAADGEKTGWFFRVPFDDLRWRLGRIKRAPLSADQKASQAARLAEIRKRLSANQAAEPSRGLPGATSDQSSTEEA